MFITFMGSTSRAGICVACLKLTTLGRRIVNRLYVPYQRLHFGTKTSAGIFNIVTTMRDTAHKKLASSTKCLLWLEEKQITSKTPVLSVITIQMKYTHPTQNEDKMSINVQTVSYLVFR